MTSICISNIGSKENPYLNLPIKERIKGYFYLHNGEVRYWDGKRFRKICKEEGCCVQSTFNFEGETKGLYCAAHKLDDMVDVKSSRCKEEGCNVQPNFNFEGEIKGLFCAAHKLDDMVNVKNPKCKEEGCCVQSIFNFEGETKGLFCAVHKLENMVDVKNPKCKTFMCPTHVGAKYDGFCLRCYMYLFPDKPVARNYKTKEYTVVEFVREHFPELSWKTDKIIHEGCSKKRPDILLDLGYQIIIIEIDENQHTSYDCSCDNKRTMELSQDLGHRPIIFIRFNPDGYMKNGEKIKSCWGNNKNGICVIKNELEWQQRLNVLKEQIEYWKNPSNKTNKTIETIQLFYGE